MTDANKTSFERARQPQQKKQRLATILSSAKSLFEQRSIDDVTMREIAEKADMGKASLYHYFQTKEEVFLELLLIELQQWAEEFAKRVGRMRKPTPERVAELMVSLSVQRECCTRLAALLSAVLERKITTAKLRAFKARLLTPMGLLSASLQQAFPDKTEQQISDFWLNYHVVISGLWPLANPTQELQQAISLPELQMFQVDFSTRLKQMLIRMLA